MDQTDAERDLAEYLSEPAPDDTITEDGPDGPVERVGEGFNPDGHLAAIGYLARDIRAIEYAANVQIGRVQEFVADRTHGPKREIARHESLLESWLAAQIAADPRGPKSREFVNGALSSHQTGGRAQVTDPDALRRFAHDEFPLAQGAWTMPEVIALPLELVQALVGYAIDARRPDSSAEFMAATRDAVKAAEQAIIDQGKVAANVIAKAAKWTDPKASPETGEVTPGRYTYHGKTVPGLTRSDEGRNYKIEVRS